MTDQITIELAYRIILNNIDNLTIEQFNNIHNEIKNRIKEFAIQQEEAYKAHKKSQEYVTKIAQEENNHD